MNIISRVWHLTNSVGNHKVQVCYNDISQEEAVIRYIHEGLLNGEAVIVLARPTLRKAIMSKIDLLDWDVRTMRSIGQIKFFDAELLLSSLEIDGVLEEQAFQECIVTWLQTSQSKFGKVRVFSGLVDTLWKDEHSATAMELEALWTGLAQTQEFSLLCSYSLGGLDAIIFEESLERICEYHNHLISCDSSEMAINASALDTFEAAWIRVMEKLTTSSKLPGEITRTTLLN